MSDKTASAHIADAIFHARNMLRSLEAARDQTIGELERGRLDKWCEFLGRAVASLAREPRR